GGTADRNRSHWSTSKTPSYTKSVSWQHHPITEGIALGFMSYCIMKVCTGRWRDLNLCVVVVAALFALKIILVD
ncbi:NCS2 family permease, partial [Escherichia coli]|nr:NCS2 family permease [Escherichia coli]